MKKKYNLLDKFELKGIWFLPAKKDQKITGTLYCNKGDVTLETIGTLSDDTGISLEHGKDIGIIQGITTTGENIKFIGYPSH